MDEKEVFNGLMKSNNLPNFQKDYMTHFRRIQTHSLIRSRSRSALDFFENKTNLALFCFDSGTTTSEEIIKRCIRIIDGPSDYGNVLVYEIAGFIAKCWAYFVDKMTKADDNVRFSLVQNTSNYMPFDVPPTEGSVKNELEGVEWPSVPVETWAYSIDWRSPEIERQPLNEVKYYTQDDIPQPEITCNALISETTKIAKKTQACINYFQKLISPSIFKGIITAAEVNAEEAIDKMANYMMVNNEGAKMPCEKILRRSGVPILTNYHFDHDQSNRKFIFHLE